MPTCEIDYKDDEKGTTQICLKQPPNQARTKVGGHWACKECQAFIKAEIKKRTGANSMNIWQAMKRSN